MIPNIINKKEQYKLEYPLADFACKHLSYNKDYFVQDITGISRYSPAECTLDNNKRNCEGSCLYYKKQLLLFRILDVISDLFK